MKTVEMSPRKLLLLVLAVISLVFISPSLAPSVHASGLVYVLPQTTAIQPVGSSFTVQIQVAGIDQFNGWDILIRSDSSVINATSLSIASNIFDINTTGNHPFETYHCINGVNSLSPDCSADGPGTVHSSVVYFGSTQLASGDGLLFSVTYKVVGPGTYSPIVLQQIIITNPNPVQVTPQDGLYGIPPGQGFTITSSSNSAKILIGSKVAFFLNVSSFGGYSGTVGLSPYVPTGLSFYLNVSSVSVSPTQSSLANLTIVSDPTYNQASQYTVTITATGSGFPEQLSLTVNTLEQPGFFFGVSPSKLKIHAGNSGSSIVTVAADPGFAGTVHLRMDVPPVPGLVASLGDSDLVISESNPGSTIFSIRTPPSDVPFTYLINITASSQSSTHPPFTIYVVSPPPDFNFQVGASSFVVQAGQSRTFSLNATSVDYFTGQLYLLASSLSGMKEVFSRGSIRLDSTNSSTRMLSSTSLITITTDADLAPGNHYINVTALGTTFLGALGPQVNHSVIITVTVTAIPISRTILGLQPVAYFGLVGALWLGLIWVAVKEIRRPKPKRFLG